MTTLKFADTHNMVAFLSKPAESDGFEQIVDFLNAHPIKYALTINPTIYISCIEQFWSTVKVKTINGDTQLHALVDGKKIIITESSVRRDLKLEDEEGMIRNLDNVSGKFLMYPRKPKRNDTQVPQSSDPGENVIDKVVHKDLGDSLVRAATTASSLEAVQDSDNITKTRSKATPNESSSLGTTLGGGPRCQETMRDTIAQTRFENVSTLSNDSLLARGNTLRNDEYRLKLEELMTLCTNLQNRVLDLEMTKTTQANEIVSLKRRIKKLKKKNRKVLGEDAPNTEDYALMADEDITAGNARMMLINEIFDVNALNDKEVFVVGQNENVVEEVVDAAQVLDKGKGIMIEEPVNPIKKKDLIRLDEEAALKLQAEFDEEESLAREKVEDEVWKLQNRYKVLEWKLYDSCRVHSLMMQSMQIYMLVEKKYPLTPPTLSMMLDKKLQIDYESEMAYQLCKLIMKQLKK
ncbi:hypothetical protein Tco_1556636 [Tanacetum coccineum]